MLAVLIISFLVLQFGDFSSGESAPFFRSDYIYNSDHQSFYKVATSRNWTDAKATCKREGAALAVPLNEAEAEVIISLLVQKDLDLGSLYIGVQDILSEGEFTTIYGVPIDEVYNKWQEWQPDNAHGVENCVVLRKDGFLNDVPCYDIMPYVCKKTLDSLEWNAECNLPYSGYQLNTTLQKCYKFHLTPKSWIDAFAICAAEESYLTVLDSKEEADGMVAITAAAPKDDITGDYVRGAVHVGFHNRFQEGWETIFGVPIELSGYGYWPSGQPDNADPPEDCGSIFYTGELNDINCTTKLFFICEHDVTTSNTTVGTILSNEV